MAAKQSFTWPEARGTNGEPLDTVFVEGLRVDCIVGAYTAERGWAQPLVIDAALHLSLSAVADSGRLASTVDYARIAVELQFIAEYAHFMLLESVAESLARYLVAAPTADMHRAAIAAVSLRLTKPLALREGAVPGVIVHRRAADMRYERVPADFGEVETIYAAPGRTIQRLHVAPGRTVVPEKSAPASEHDLQISSDDAASRTILRVIRKHGGVR